MQKLSWIESVTLVGLVLIWISHAIGIFTPEVGFDAVWYHLPVIKMVVEARRLVYMPELYQSVNPMVSDLIFGIGYVLFGELGTKITAYLFGLALIAATYCLAKQAVSRQWALLVALTASTFQVVAWQSSSFYVDVAKAMWELAALWALVKWQRVNNNKFLLISALLFGMSLGTKLFSLLLLPVLLLFIGLSKKEARYKNVFIFLGVCLLIPLPFYIFSYYHTGTPWYSFAQHLGKIGEIGEHQSVMGHLIARTLQLPTFWRELLFGKDYTTPLLVVFSPLALWYGKDMVKNKQLLILLVWSVVQIGLWWFMPPLSTRYALSGFVTILILCFWAVQKFAKTHVVWPLYVAIGLVVVTMMMPRLFVNYRSLHYIFGYQTKDQYVRQFFDGHVDEHLRRWHGLN